MTHVIDFACVDDGDKPTLATFQQAKARGCVGVKIRCEFDEGTTPMADEDWKLYSDLAAQAGLLIGPYAIFNWIDPQVDRDLDLLYAITGKLDPKTHMVPSLDIEFPQGIVGTRHTIAQLVGTQDQPGYIRQYAKGMRDRYGVWNEFYFSGRVWNTTDTDTLGNPPAPDLIDCSPWCAAYVVDYHQDPILDPSGSWGLGKYGAPNPWGWAFLHQYQGDSKYGLHGLVQCDLSRVCLISSGMSGPAVRWVQTRCAAYLARLALKGVTVPDALLPLRDGEFDTATVQRVQLVQKYEGMYADGIVGLFTHNALNWVPV